jgi:O-antigen/teichoic acid export membrane protein
MGRVMLRKSPWLRQGIGSVRIARVRRLAFPAIAYMAFPVGNALSIQGMVIVIGLVLGPVAVTTFSAMRTLTRFALQIAATIALGIYPELSAAYGAQNWNLARKLHRMACQASLWLSLVAVGFLFFAGGRIMTVWSHGHIIMDVSAFRLLLLVVIANSFWNTSSVVTMASNKHQRIAVAYLAATIATIIVAYWLLPRYALSGAAMALLIVDITVGWFVVKSSLTELDEGFRQFLKALVRVPGGLQRL